MRLPTPPHPRLRQLALLPGEFSPLMLEMGTTPGRAMILYGQFPPRQGPTLKTKFVACIIRHNTYEPRLCD